MDDVDIADAYDQAFKSKVDVAFLMFARMWRDEVKDPSWFFVEDYVEYAHKHLERILSRRKFRNQAVREVLVPMATRYVTLWAIDRDSRVGRA